MDSAAQNAAQRAAQTRQQTPARQGQPFPAAPSNRQREAFSNSQFSIPNIAKCSSSAWCPALNRIASEGLARGVKAAERWASQHRWPASIVRERQDNRAGPEFESCELQ